MLEYALICLNALRGLFLVVPTEDVIHVITLDIILLLNGGVDNHSQVLYSPLRFDLSAFNGHFHLLYYPPTTNRDGLCFVCMYITKFICSLLRKSVMEIELMILNLQVNSN